MAEKEIAEMSNHPGPHLVVTLQTKNESGGGGEGVGGGGGDSYSSLGPLPSQVDYELMSIISKILRIQNPS